MQINSEEFDEMVRKLAVASVRRYNAAIWKEGSTQIEAIQEIIRTILEVYHEKLSQ